MTLPKHAWIEQPKGFDGVTPSDPGNKVLRMLAENRQALAANRSLVNDELRDLSEIRACIDGLQAALGAKKAQVNTIVGGGMDIEDDLAKTAQVARLAADKFTS